MKCIFVDIYDFKCIAHLLMTSQINTHLFFVQHRLAISGSDEWYSGWLGA